MRAELAKEKSKNGGVTTYTIRQVVFTLSPGDGAEWVEEGDAALDSEEET